MENIINMLIENPFVAALIASPIGLVLIWAVYKAVLKIILSDKNIDKLADDIDKAVDEVQKKDKEAGKQTRQRLIALATMIITKLKEDDGYN